MKILAWVVLLVIGGGLLIILFSAMRYIDAMRLLGVLVVASIISLLLVWSIHEISK